MFISDVILRANMRTSNVTISSSTIFNVKKINNVWNTVTASVAQHGYNPSVTMVLTPYNKILRDLLEHLMTYFPVYLILFWRQSDLAWQCIRCHPDSLETHPLPPPLFGSTKKCQYTCTLSVLLSFCWEDFILGRFSARITCRFYICIQHMILIKQKPFTFENKNIHWNLCCL